MVKTISQWLRDTTDSHGIQSYEPLQRDFNENTGLKDELPKHTVAQCSAGIVGRGKGGQVNGKGFVCYGYEVAESLARTYADWHPYQMGLGFRWNSAIEALERAGK